MRIATPSPAGMLRRCLTVLAAVIVTFSVVAGAGNVTAADAAPAPRSVNVTFFNFTGCDLNLTAQHLNHGSWSINPPSYIGAGKVGSWRSRSSGLLTGTEGRVTYRTSDCAIVNLKQKDIRLHWNNPFIGSNSYDSVGTDPAFRVSYNGGSGNEANVNFFAQRNL